MTTYNTTQTINAGNSRTFNSGDIFSGITNHAIVNNGTVTTDGVLVTANTCSAYGAGIYTWANFPSQENATAAIINNSTFSDNYSAQRGTAVYIDDKFGSMTVKGSTFSNNIAETCSGAIEFGGASCSISGSLFDGNQGKKEKTQAGAVTIGTGGTAENGRFLWEYLDISNSIFVDNQGQNGGGLFVGVAKEHTSATGSPYIATVSGSTFSGNVAQAYGGAIETCENLHVEECLFHGNTSAKSGNGGAINSSAGGTQLLEITNSTFTSNVVTSDQYPPDGYGGAVNVAADTFSVTNSLFHDNSAHRSGGAIYAYHKEDAVTITNSTFTNNVAGEQGGGIGSSSNKSTAVSSSLFSENSAGTNGGGLYVASTSTSISGSTFSQNTAVNNGGGMYTASTASIVNSTFSQNTAVNNGGGLFNSTRGNATATADIFTGNNAANGGAVYNNGALTSTASTYSGNTATNGGAWYNAGTATSKNDLFSANTVISGSSVDEPYCGGAVYNGETGAFAADGSTFSQNTAEHGCALYNAGTAEVTGSTFTENETGSTRIQDFFGGAVYNSGTFASSTSTYSQNNSGQMGGALCNVGVATSTRDTFTGNDAVAGGAVYLEGNTVSSVIFISNTSTYSENTAINGAAICNRNGGTVTSTGDMFTSNIADFGGAVHNDDTESIVSVADATFTGNTANEEGGAVYNIHGTFTSRESLYSGNESLEEGGNTGTPGGGAIANLFGKAFSTKDTFSGNSAVADGGAVLNANNKSEFLANSSTFTNNSAGRNGGAVFNYIVSGQVVLNASYFGTNTAEALGGAVFNNKLAFSTASIYEDNTAGTKGGAIYNGATASSTGDTFRANTATSSGGAVYNQGLFMSSTSSHSENTASSGGAIYNFSTFTSTGDNYSKNTATSSGGAVYNQGLFMSTASNYSENTAASSGGAIYNSSTFTSNASSYSENTAASNGGAVFNSKTTSLVGDFISKNTAKNGGAGYNYYNATLSISGSTVTENTASSNGGAVYNYSNATTSISGSTLTGNCADNNGGAVYNDNAATTSISSSIFTGNSATLGGAIFNSRNAFVHIAGSTFATASDSIKNNGQVYFSGDNILNAVLDGSGLSHSEAVTSIKGAGTVGQNYVAEGHETTFDGLKVDATVNGGGGTNTLIGATLNFDNVSMTTSTKIYGAGVADEGSFANIVYVNFTGSTGMGAKALVCAGGKGAAGTDIFANNIEVTSSVESGDMGILYGGADLTDGGSFKAGIVTTTISGNGNYLSFVGNGCRNGNKSSGIVTTYIETSNVSISGGTFQNLVYGGAYAAGDSVTCGTANMTISGGTFNFSVYGGNGGKSTATTSNGKSVVGSVNVTVDVTGSNTVVFNRHLSSGSFGDGTVSGDTHMTFTGDGANLSFGADSYVTGHSQNAYHLSAGNPKLSDFGGTEYVQTFVNGSSSLVFDSFTGDFKGSLSNGFTNVSISSDSSVALKGAAESDLRFTSVWNLAVGSSTATLLDWSGAANAMNSFKGDTINLSFDEDYTLSGAKVLMDFGTDDKLFTGWDSATVTLGGSTMSYNSDNKYYSDGSYKLYVDTTDGSKLMLASL